MSTTTIIGRGPSSVDFPDAPTQQAESAPLGFAVYNDVATETTKINIQADVWTDMTNDGAGGTTNIAFLPNGVTNLWDANNSQVVISQLQNNNYCTIRLQFKATTKANEAVISMRLFWTTQSGFQFDLTKRIGSLNEGAGEYSLSEEVLFYVGDDDSRQGFGKIQIKCDSEVDVEVDTIFVGIN